MIPHSIDFEQSNGLEDEQFWDRKKTFSQRKRNGLEPIR